MRTSVVLFDSDPNNSATNSLNTVIIFEDTDLVRPRDNVIEQEHGDLLCAETFNVEPIFSNA